MKLNSLGFKDPELTDPNNLADFLFDVEIQRYKSGKQSKEQALAILETLAEAGSGLGSVQASASKMALEKMRRI